MPNKISDWLESECYDISGLAREHAYAAQLDRLVEAVKDAICGLEIYAAVNPMVKSEGLAAMHKNLLAALRDIELPSHTKEEV